MAFKPNYRVKELSGYLPRNKYFEAVDFWGSEFFETRNQPPTAPDFRISLETENHYSNIDLQIKPELRSPEGIQKLVAGLEGIMNYSVKYVRVTNENGVTDYLYSRGKNVPLPPDSDFTQSLRLVINARDVVGFVFSRSLYTSTEGKSIIWLKKFVRFLAVSFLDSLGRPLKRHQETLTSSIDGPKWYMKSKQHSLYNVPHTDAQESPIEEKLRQAMEQLEIPFLAQKEIMIDGQLLTKPDFLIETPLIAIYCDGIEFHKDAQRIIKDKQQDRILQRLGYMVFRFSGSEIHANARNCAIEIDRALREFKNKTKPYFGD